MTRSNKNLSRLPLTIVFSAYVSLLAACGGDASEPPASAADTAGQVVTRVQPQDQVPASAAPAAPREAAPGRQYSGPDIMGIYLGMSPEEVMAVLEADASGFQIQRSEYTFSYEALGNRYRTDPFLRGIVAASPRSEIMLEIGISPPPSTPQVTGISRNHRQREGRLPLADYANALIEKYGAPASDVTAGEGTQLMRTLTWTLPGGTRNCIRPSGTVIESVLDKFRDSDGRRIEAQRDQAQQCAPLFQYVLHEDPVRAAIGHLIDVASAAEFEFMALDWVDELAAEKAKPGTERPSL